MRRSLVQLAGPVVLIALVGFWGSFLSNARAIEFEHALVFTAIVVGLYVFIGNSGVISFGQIGFFLVGAYAAGELSIPAETKSSILPNVYGLIREHSVGNFWSLVIAALAGGIFAFLVGIPLMRLSGLAAGIATFAVLEITQNILGNWESIGPGPLTLSTVPQTTDLWQATVGAIAVACVAFGYQLSPLGRKLRATREDPFAAQAAGIDVHRQRLWAFTISGMLAGFAGGLFVHFQGSLATDVAPRLHVPDTGDARRRRLAEPVRCGRRLARDQRDRFVPERRGDGRRQLAAPTRGHEPRRRGGVHGGGADVHAPGPYRRDLAAPGAKRDRPRPHSPAEPRARRAAGRRSRRRRPVVQCSREGCRDERVVYRWHLQYRPSRRSSREPIAVPAEADEQRQQITTPRISAEIQAVVAEIDARRDVLRSEGAESEARGELTSAAFDVVWSSGALRICVPPKFGGYGANSLESTAVSRALGREMAPLPGCSPSSTLALGSWR